MMGCVNTLKLIKVLVVDDSALMRKIISDLINSQDDLEVIATAKNGQDLFLKLEKVKPDVITLDVEMPIMDGISTLREMKRQNINIKVIVLSSVSTSAAGNTMNCLQAGAFDFVAKPSGAISLDINKVVEELAIKIRAADGSSSNILPKEQYNKTVEYRNLNKLERNQRIDAVVLGASTGGPKALYSVITKLPLSLNVPVFVVQHMPVGFTKAFADRLNDNCALTVVEADEGMAIENNKVYIAKAGFHMEIGSNKRIGLNEEPSIWGVRPAVDIMFKSASKVYGNHLVSVVLTGMGKDGADGTRTIKTNGGITISEDKSTCVIYGMPKVTFETGMVDMVLPLGEVSKAIIKIVNFGR